MYSQIVGLIIINAYLICSLEAMQLSGLNFDILKNTKCAYNVTEYLNASTAIRCATECGKRRGCSMVNFKRPTCEILDYEPGVEALLIAEHDWKCIFEYNECESSPCIHGNCIYGKNDYACECFSGFEGVYCTGEINECESSPCVHGSCTDQPNSYMCICNAGYQGVNCEEEIDECQSSPCNHGGECIDSVNGYTCDCNYFHQGIHCDECTGVVYESKCYVKSERSPTWFNAREFCVSEGGNLAVSCNAGVNDILADFNTDSTTWIGAAYFNGTWQWETNECPAFGGYTAWRNSGAANPTSDKCMVIFQGGWGAAGCENRKPCICEYHY